jgi:hypothetical protein
MKPMRRLCLALLAVLLLPWLVGTLVKTRLQPGLVDDAERAALLVDFVVAGSIVSGLALLAVYAIGLWIVAVMKGPRREADSFPVDSPR